MTELEQLQARARALEAEIKACTDNDVRKAKLLIALADVWREIRRGRGNNQ